MQNQNAIHDRVWSLIAATLPPERGRPCRPAQDNRTCFEAMAWLALTGAVWRQLPPNLGNWNSVHRRYRRWINDGVFEVVLGELTAQLDASPSDGAARQAYSLVALVCSNLEARGNRTNPVSMLAMDCQSDAPQPFSSHADAPASDLLPMSDSFAAELLSAYLDGELDEAAKDWLEHEMRDNPRLASRLAQWRANDAGLRDQVRQVDELPMPAWAMRLLVSGNQRPAED